MSLFQPTNIIPSSFSGIENGVVSPNDPFKISWQVNGNSPMTGYTVEIAENLPTPGIMMNFVNDLKYSPFYGKDQNGNAQYYTYQSEKSWAEMFSDIGFAAGKEYRFYINQKWDGGEVNQLSPSIIKVRTRPNLQIQAIPETLDQIKYTFQANFSQNEGDTVNWCKWTLATVSEHGKKTVVEDTGVIYTSKLEFSYNGFTNNQTYAIQCEVQTSSGMLANTGWNEFVVSYQTTESNERIDVVCCNDSSVLLDVGDTYSSDGSMSPEASVPGFYEESLFLKDGESITWDETNIGERFDFKDCTVSWQGDVTGLQKLFEAQSGGIKRRSPVIYYENGVAKFLYVIADKASEESYGDLGKCRIECYSIDTVTGTILYTSSSPEIEYNSSLSVNSQKSLLVARGGGNIAIYRITPEDGSLTLPATPLLDTSDMGSILLAEFSPNGEYLVIGEEGNTLLYSVSATAITFLQEVLLDGASFISLSVDFYELNNTILKVLFTIIGNCIGAEFAMTNGVLQQETKLIEYPSGYMSLLSNFVYHRYGDIIYAYGSVLDNTYKIQQFSKVFLRQTNGSLTETEGTFPPSASRVKIAVAGDRSFIVALNYNDETIFYSASSVPSDNYEPPQELFRLPAPQDGSTGTKEDHLAFFEIDDTTFGFVSAYSSIEVFKKSYLATQITNGITLYYSAINGFDLKGSRAMISVGENGSQITFLQSGGLEQTFTSSSGLGYNNFTSVTLSGPSQTDALILSQGNRYLSYGEIEAKSIDYFNFVGSSYNLLAYASNVPSVQKLIYREEGDVVKNVLNYDGIYAQIKDFGVKSGKQVKYDYMIEETNGEITNLSITSPFKSILRSYYLIEATQDPLVSNLFHALNVWRFGNNISAGSVSNNNNPNWYTNFTPYRLKQHTTRAGRSGTLQALLSNVCNSSYQDTPDMQDKLFQASLSNNPFFLKDMKGNIYMVSISSPIVQSINTASSVQQVSVSVPWEEIGDASECSIIQLPSDDGWMNNMVAKVILDVDVETGLLTATYPDSYFGTRFKLEGNNLIAITPGDVPRAVIYLSGNSVIAQTQE